MSHDLLVPILMLVSIPALLLLGALSKSQREINWERRKKIKEALIMARLPHCVQLWRNLLIAIQDKKSESEIKKRVDEIEDYIKFMVR